jgi:protein ImuB
VHLGLTGEIGRDYQSHLAAATLDSCFEHKSNYVSRSLMCCCARAPGKSSVEFALADFYFDLVRMNHDMLTCARSFSPRVQDKTIDLIVLDIDGLQGLFGSPEQIAARIHSSLLRERLTGNVAVASNPDSATIAARGYAGVSVLAEAAQIRPLPLTLLDLSPSQLETLDLWGITTLGGLAALDAKALSQRLGQQGVQLQKLARGQQVNPFVADEEQIEFRERSELECSIDLLDSLSFVLASLLERICLKLEEHSLATNEVDYELALDPPRVAGEDLPDDRLFFRRTIKLPNPTTDRTLLLRLLQLDLQAHPPGAAVLKVSLRVDAVRPHYIQQGLLAPQMPDPGKLELLTARLANLVGKQEVGSLELLDTHRPRAFVMARFEPETDSDIPLRSRGGSSRVTSQGVKATQPGEAFCARL